MKSLNSSVRTTWFCRPNHVDDRVCLPFPASLCVRPDRRVRTPFTSAHFTCQRATEAGLFGRQPIRLTADVVWVKTESVRNR
jgi:hypothetical protein